MKSYLSFKLYGLFLVVSLILVYSGKSEAAVIKLTQSKAQSGNVTPGDAPGFPITISTTGTFILDGNLTVPANKHGIEITADNVTLDLNGFTIQGSGDGTGFGVYAGSANRVVVQNGKVVDMGATGIHVGQFSRVERVIVSNCGGYTALGVGQGSSVVGCTVSDNDAIGINTGNNVLVTGNVLMGNSGTAISIGSGTVSGNAISQNDSDGIYVYYNGLVIGNSITENAGKGVTFAYGSHAGYRENLIDGNALGTVYGGTNMGSNMCSGDLVCP